MGFGSLDITPILFPPSPLKGEELTVDFLCVLCALCGKDFVFKANGRHPTHMNQTKYFVG